jgi:hypothetical protein
MAQPTSIQVIGAKPGTTVQPVPGKVYYPLPDSGVELIGVAEMVPAGGGTWRPVVRVCPRRVPIRPDELKRLGIAISPAGMVRLVRAGFVAGGQTTPGINQFDYLDYRRHEAAVESDPEFWDRTEPGHSLSNRLRFRRALLLERETPGQEEKAS